MAPKEPEIPNKPPLYVEKPGAMRAWMALRMRPVNTLYQPSRLLGRPYVTATGSGPTILRDGRIGYWRQAIRQRRILPLKPLLLRLEDPVTAFDLSYEIRGSNVPGVSTGRLLVRLSPISELNAMDKVYRALRHANRKLVHGSDEVGEIESIPDEAD